ncbi:MAG: tetratricopeptide repeat protein [Bacteroidia bacterium]|nr:tetratricopeptide repeat protein [Methylotenera sp.]
MLSLNTPSPTLLEQGIALHQQGHYTQAIQCYEAILAQSPNHPDALHLIGEAHYRQGAIEAGLHYVNRAIAQNPQAIYFNTRGTVLLALQQYLLAEQDLKQAIKLAPNYLEAHINLSNVFRQNKAYKNAKRYADKALSLNPQSAAAWNAFGSVQMEQGKLIEAIEGFNQALGIEPNYWLAAKNKAVILCAQKNWPQALPLLENVVASTVDIETCSLLSRAYIVLGEPDKAITPFQQAMQDMSIAQRKTYFESADSLPQLFAICDALTVSKLRFSDAANLYQLAMEALPNHGLLLNNLAVAQFNQAQFIQSTELLFKLLEIEPANVQARTNLGVSLIMLDRSEEAIAQFKIALEYEPNFLAAAGWMIGEKNRICDWESMPALREKVASLLDNPNNIQSVNSFILLSNYDDPAKFLQWSRRNSKENFANLGITTLPVSGIGRQHKRIRVGYFSVDFRNHPVSHLTAPLFGLHDRKQFEVWVYSYGPDDGHPVRARIKDSAEHFVDLEHHSIEEMVARIRTDEIDILMDLSGNTRGSRSQVLGHRPAPVQAQWLGFVGTMGSHYYDYTIVDHFVAPKDADAYFEEKLVRMPDCFQINDTLRPPLDIGLTRAQCNLPANMFVFCDFNQSFKIQPEIFTAWVSILQQVPNSVLWLADGHADYLKNIRAEWQKAGLDLARLIIAPRVSVEQHVPRYQLADLFLDVFPYTSGTTASDALWAGCPLLALVGNTMVARMAGSLVQAAELPELITYSIAEYVQKAVYYATHPQELALLRQRLITNRAQLPLFDTPSFVNNLENAYSQMAQMARNGEPLSAITV